MMATDWNAMQGAQSVIGKEKARRPLGDVNLRQMSMGSWKASLSKGGQARGLKGITHGTQAVVAGKK